MKAKVTKTHEGFKRGDQVQVKNHAIIDGVMYAIACKDKKSGQTAYIPVTHIKQVK